MATLVKLTESHWINLDQIIGVNDQVANQPPRLRVSFTAPVSAYQGTQSMLYEYDLYLYGEDRTALLAALADHANPRFARPTMQPTRPEEC